LLTIDALSSSPDEDYRDAADILQNQLYYQGETLSSVTEVLRTFSQQSQK
jgi:replication fork protection complex subunit Tof1/Swi1